MRSRLLLVAGIGLLLSCDSPFEPPLDAIEFPGLPSYGSWWAEVEACAQTTGDLGRVRWFMVPHDNFQCGGQVCIGLWTPEHHIYLSYGAHADREVVKHEMLHDLLDDGAHYQSAWDECDLRRPLID
jgi:hypothetical protein